VKFAKTLKSTQYSRKRDPSRKGWESYQNVPKMLAKYVELTKTKGQPRTRRQRCKSGQVRT